MKNKRGFTLVELLAVIIVIGILTMVAIPTIERIAKENREKVYQQQLDNIVLSLKSWASDNRIHLPEEENENLTMTLGNLKSEGYIEHEVKNPLTGKCFDNRMTLVITKEQNNYDYSINLDTIEESNECEVDIDSPTIVLNGNMTENIEVNSLYVDKGVIAKDKDGNDITAHVSTTISGSGNVVDTSNIGNRYIITYSITANDKTVRISRIVKIVDTIAPELIIPTDTTINVMDTSFDVMEGVSAIDNSGETISVEATSNISLEIVGDYTITYTATDSSGNKITKKRILTIEFQNNIMSSDSACITDENIICPVGTEVNVQVNSNDNYDFRVLNDTGVKLTLIMNSKLGEPVEWLSREDYEAAGGKHWDEFKDNNQFGPITALIALKARTLNWTNITAYSYELNYGSVVDYDSNIYEGIYSGAYVQNVRARMLTLAEATSEAIGCTIGGEKCPTWLYEGVNSSIEGYWLSDADESLPYNAWGIYNNGYLHNLFEAGSKSGIRPVIEVYK